MGLIDDLKNLDWRLAAGHPGRLCRDPGGDGDPGHALRAVHPSAPRRGGDGPLDRRADQRVQHARQHGRAGGERRPDRRGACSAGRRSRSAACSRRRSCWSWSGPWAGFLVHNHAPARLFMGDAGSNFLGFLLGALDGRRHVHQAQGYSPYGVLAPLLVMAVPLYDMTSVILIRLREGRSPFVGDRRHFSHRLVARGLTPPQAVWTIDLVTLAGGLGALLLHRLDVAGRVRRRGPDRAACWGSWPSWNSRRAVRSKEMARRGAKSSVPPKPRTVPTAGCGTGDAGRHPGRLSTTSRSPGRRRPTWASASAASPSA